MTDTFQTDYPFTLPNYDWERRIPIGQSSYSTVYKVRILHSKEEYVAIKRFILPKTYLAYEMFLDQLEKLKNIKSQFIVKYIDSQIYQEGGYIVLELCQCNLGTYLTKYQWKMPESVGQTIVSHIVESLTILRKQNFYSVYVNPNNFLIKKGITKLNPIGLGKYQVDLKQTSISSLPLYMAPQVIVCGDLNRSQNNSKADIWSVGIIAYELSTGSLPFSYQSWDTYRTRILSQDISIEDKHFLSLKMKDFISKCLVKDKKERASWQVISHHPIIQKHKSAIPKRLFPQVKNIWKRVKLSRQSSQANIKAELQHQIQNIKLISLNSFKQISLNNNPHLQQKQVHQIFNQYDLSNKKQISPNELANIYKIFRIQQQNQYQFMKQLAQSIKKMNIDIYKISQNFDSNKNNHLDKEQMKLLIRSILPKSSKKMIQKVWNHLLSVHHGSITTYDMLQDLLRYLPQQQSQNKTRAQQAYQNLKKALLDQKKQIKSMFSYFDSNDDDRINFKQFKMLFNSLVGFQRLQEMKIVFNIINKSKTGLITLAQYKDIIRNTGK